MIGSDPTSSLAQLRAVAFPRNVYARALELEVGQVESLHYGLFETPDMPITAAQRRSTELLCQHLPPPCRLLEVGVGSGTTLARLTDAGYAVTGIAPDPSQVARARNKRDRHGADLRVVCSRLEDFAGSPGEWDALVFHESAQYIAALDLFTQADRLLTDRGEIVIIDEFALRRTEPNRENLHLLPHFIALAERFGFVVADCMDLSRQAAPTLDFLVQVIPRHAARLENELGVTAEALAALTASNTADREKYTDGRYGYVLLKLRRGAHPRWRVGRIDSHNAVEMRALFAQVFHHQMSEEHWRWKYGEGRGTAIGVWQNRQLIAHYGGVVMDIMYFGEPQTAAQSCDVMVAQAGRATLSRQGPLFLAAATYLESELGYGNPHLLGVGFPNVRAWKAPARLGLYGGPVGRMVELTWPASLVTHSPAIAVRPLDLNDADDRIQAEVCWNAMRADLSKMIVRVRNATALHHRYTAHPDKVYRLFVVQSQSSSIPLGLFVLQPNAEGGCELMDTVGPIAALPLLVTQARHTAASLGAERLFGWVVDNIRPNFGRDATVRDLQIFIPANAWTAAPPIEDLVDSWWLTGGDTDFH